MPTGKKPPSGYNMYTAYNLHGQRPPPGQNLLPPGRMAENGAQWKRESPQEKAKWNNQARIAAKK